MKAQVRQGEDNPLYLRQNTDTLCEWRLNSACAGHWGDVQKLKELVGLLILIVAGIVAAFDRESLPIALKRVSVW